MPCDWTFIGWGQLFRCSYIYNQPSMSQSRVRMNGESQEMESANYHKFFQPAVNMNIKSVYSWGDFKIINHNDSSSITLRSDRDTFQITMTILWQITMTQSTKNFKICRKSNYILDGLSSGLGNLRKSERNDVGIMLNNSLRKVTKSVTWCMMAVQWTNKTFVNERINISNKKLQLWPRKSGIFKTKRKTIGLKTKCRRF